MSLRVEELYALKYIGSKRRMARIIAAMLSPLCTTYVEPFCGSAAVALHLAVDHTFESMVLNDLNSHIANFWRVASSRELSPLLLAALSKTTYSQTLFNEAKARKEEFGANRKDLLQWAVDTYVLNWQSFNGASEHWRYVKPEPYYTQITDCLKLPTVLDVLCNQNIAVYNRNALDLMTEGGFLEDEHTFIFLDPPYAEGLRCDGRLYEVDMGDVRDHIDLLNTIKQSKAKIVLSGYWSGRDDGTDLYDQYLLPHGWHRHLLGEYTKSMKSTEEKGKGAEWVWTNFEVSRTLEGRLGSYNDEQKSPALMAWLNSLHNGGEAV